MGFHATIILDFPDEDIIVGSCWIKNPPCEPSQNNKPTSLSVKKDKWNENPLPFFALNTLYHPKVLQTFRLLIQILLEIFNPSRILFGVVLKYSRTTFLDRNLHQCTLPILHFFPLFGLSSVLLLLLSPRRSRSFKTRFCLKTISKLFAWKSTFSLLTYCRF